MTDQESWYFYDESGYNWKIDLSSVKFLRAGGGGDGGGGDGGGGDGSGGSVVQQGPTVMTDYTQDASVLSGQWLAVNPHPCCPGNELCIPLLMGPTQHTINAAFHWDDATHHKDAFHLDDGCCFPAGGKYTRQSPDSFTLSRIPGVQLTVLNINEMRWNVGADVRKLTRINPTSNTGAPADQEMGRQ